MSTTNLSPSCNHVQATLSAYKVNLIYLSY